MPLSAERRELLHAVSLVIAAEEYHHVEDAEPDEYLALVEAYCALKRHPAADHRLLAAVAAAIAELLTLEPAERGNEGGERTFHGPLTQAQVDARLEQLRSRRSRVGSPAT